MSRNVRDMQRAAEFQTPYSIFIWANDGGYGYGHWEDTGAVHHSHSRAKQALHEYLLENQGPDGTELVHGRYQARHGDHHAELQFTGGKAVA